MSVRRAMVAGMVALAVTGGVVALDQAGGAAAAAVPSIQLGSTVSMTEPWIGGISRSAAGTVFSEYAPGGDGGRSRLLRPGVAGAEDLGPLVDRGLPAGIQDDVVAVPTSDNSGISVVFRTAAGLARGSVSIGREERYLGQAGTGVLLAISDLTVGLRLVRRTPGAADTVLAGGDRYDGFEMIRPDAAGALIGVRTDRQTPQFTVRYVDYRTGALTNLVPSPVQGLVLDATRVGWIDGATAHIAPRTAPTALTTRTLPVSTAEFVSGDTLGWTRYDSAEQQTYFTVLPPGGPAVTRVVGIGWTISANNATDAVPDGAGGFVFHQADPATGTIAVRSTSGAVLWTAPQVTAAVRTLAVSGGRVTWTDEGLPTGQAHSQQVLAEGGELRLGSRTTLGGHGNLSLIPRGSRTLVRSLSGRYVLHAGTVEQPVAALETGYEVTGLDGNWVVDRPFSGRQRLSDLRTGSISEGQPPTDVDGGFRYVAGPVTGEVLRVAYTGGSAVRVVPPDPGCQIAEVQARQGDVYVRCASGQARIWATGGTSPLLTFESGSFDRLGSGLLWRGDGTGITATAYRTPGAVPIKVFILGPNRPWAVDREGPWAVTVNDAGRVQAYLVPGVPVPAPASRYEPTDRTPRLLDTRITGGAVVAGADRTVTVGGQVGIPTSATDVVVEVTVTKPTANGWLAAYPEGRFGGSSTVNFTPGQTVTTTAVVPIRDQRIALRVSGGSAHVVLDVVGYHVPVGSVAGHSHVPVAPARLLDTRSGVRLTTAPRVIAVAGKAGLPAAPRARAVLVNVTVTRPSGASWLAVSANGGARPTTVSFAAGQTVAALAVVPLSARGTVNLQLGGGTADVLLDVVGYVPQNSELDWRQADLLTAGPTRLLDTRTGSPVAAGADRKVPVAGSAGVPRGATAVLLTVTATRPTAASHVTAYPSGTVPTTSTLNFAVGKTVANTALVPLAADGSISLRVGVGTAHVVLDVAGYLQR